MDHAGTRNESPVDLRQSGVNEVQVNFSNGTISNFGSDFFLLLWITEAPSIFGLPQGSISFSLALRLPGYSQKTHHQESNRRFRKKLRHPDKKRFGQRCSGSFYSKSPGLFHANF